MLNLTSTFSDILKKSESGNWRYIVKIEQEDGDNVNMLTNPGFETDGAGGADVFGTWVEGVNNEGTVNKETTIIHNGSQSCKLTMGDDAGEWAKVAQTITVVAETDYIFTYYTRGDGSSAGRYAIYDVSNAGFIDAEAQTGVTGTDWVKQVRPFTTPAGCVSVRLDLVINTTVDTSCYFDDTHLQLASDYYYYSGQEFEIVDLTDNDVIRGVLKSKDIPIVQLLDWREHKASVGGFSIELIDDGLNDAWNTNPIYNRRIWLYLGTDDLSYLDDYLLLYTGVCKNWTTKKGIITLDIENSSLISQKEIPALLSNSDAAAGQSGILPDVSKGKVKPLFFGNHEQVFLKDMRDTEDGTDNIYDRGQNLVPAEFLGVDQDGDERWLISKDKTDLTPDNNIWAWDPALGRMVEISAFVIEQNTSSGCIISTDAEPTYYDYWLPDGSISNELDNDQGDGVVTITDSENSCDLDNTTKAIIDVKDNSGAPAPSGAFDIDFPEYENGGTISGVSVWALAEFETSGATYTVTINSENAENAGTGVDQPTVAQYGTEAATSAGAEASVECKIIGDESAAPQRDHQLNVHMIYKRVGYKANSRLQIFCGWRGREYSGTWNSRKTSGNLIEHPTDVIESILRDDLGLTDSKIDMDSFDAVNTELGANWKFSGYLNERKNSKEILEDLARQSISFVFWGADDKVTMDTFYAANTTNRTFDKNEIRGLPKVSKSKLSSLINDLTLTHKKEPGEGRLIKTITRVDDRTAAAGSQTKYNAVMTKDIKADFIADDTAAGLLADHWCKDDADSFWSVLRDIIEIDVPTNRGVDFWDTTFKPVMLLELLDIIELDDADYDSILKCNGVSWSGKQFKIFRIERRKLGLMIKAFSV